MQFVLHGHGLPATWLEYDWMVDAWKTSNDPTEHTFVAATIGGPDMTIILLDR